MWLLFEGSFYLQLYSIEAEAVVFNICTSPALNTKWAWSCHESQNIWLVKNELCFSAGKFPQSVAVNNAPQTGSTTFFTPASGNRSDSSETVDEGTVNTITILETFLEHSWPGVNYLLPVPFLCMHIPGTSGTFKHLGIKKFFLSWNIELVRQPETWYFVVALIKVVDIRDPVFQGWWGPWYTKSWKTSNEC